MTSTIFENSVITQDIELTIMELDNISKHNFEHDFKLYVYDKINNEIGGKCMEDGYIKPNAIKIINISCGVIHTINIRYSVTYECMICYPSEGMVITCKATSITTGGVKAVIAEYEHESPMIVFIAREISHGHINHINEGDVFIAKIIGVHFELNDTYVSILAKIVIEK
jgi:DNA-directed RNA polymerase subunit E'/Rpb7